MIWKFLLNILKPPVTALVSALTVNRDANIAKIEALAGTGTANLENVVVTFLADQAKQHAELGFLLPLVEPELLAELQSAVAAGVNTVPALYDRAVAWLKAEELAL